ncbi:hypothetical protein ACNJ69_18450 [Acinetobacter soli]|uniref:hypothetical protein n=1 Tax=Acinetobacter soli TaxID=487316 RepID=UPI003B9EE9D5
MIVHLDIKQILSEISLQDKILLSVYLLQSVSDFAHLYSDDGSYDQYLRLTEVFLKLDNSIADLLSLDLSSLNLSAD